MKRLTAAIFAASSLCGGSACAGDWGPVSAVGASETVYVDSGSVRRQGEETQFWAKTVFTPPVMNAVLKARVAAETQQNLAHCDDNTYAVAAAAYYDADGKLLKSVTWGPDQRHFEPIVPDSGADLMQRRACALVAAKASLKPRVVETLGAGNWRDVALEGDAAYRVRVDDIILTKNQLLLAIVRVDYPSGKWTDAGIGYRTVVHLVGLECTAARADIAASDYYDSDGALVAQTHKEAGEIKPADMRSGSPADKVRAAVCSIWRRDPSSVQVVGDDADAGQTFSGTAWLTSKGYLVTAAHVVEGAERLTLLQDGKEVGDAEVVASDPANDVAVLRPHFKNGAHTALGMSAAPPGLGVRVFTLGYPSPDDLGWGLKMTAGEVSALAGASKDSNNDARLLQISVPIQPGNSGGPVIDPAGRVVGIVVTRLETVGDDEVAQNVNYALKASYVRGILAELPDVGGYRLVTPSGGAVALVRTLKDGVFLLIAEKSGAP